MLHRGAETFTTSVVDFLDHEPGRLDREARIYIAIKVERLEAEIYAMVDTGSPFSIVDPEIAENAGLNLGSGEKTTVSTRFGPIPGELVRGTIILPARDGPGLEVDSTIFIPERKLPWPNFLGYRGFLERIRFAVSPAEYEFHFGAVLAPTQQRLSF